MKGRRERDVKGSAPRDFEVGGKGVFAAKVERSLVKYSKY